MTTQVLKALHGGLEKYAMPPDSALQAPANTPPAPAAGQPKAMTTPLAANSPIKPLAPIAPKAPDGFAGTASPALLTNQNFNSSQAGTFQNAPPPPPQGGAAVLQPAPQPAPQSAPSPAPALPPVNPQAPAAPAGAAASPMTDAQVSTAYPRRKTMGLPADQVAEIERRHAAIVSKSDAQYSGTQQQQSQPQKTDPFNDASVSLQGAKTPEEKEQVEKQVVPNVVEHVKASTTPEKLNQASTVVKNPESPEAQQAIATAGSDFAKQQAGGDPNKLQDPGFFGKAMGMWSDMGPMGQAAFMIGVPAALIGLLSGNALTGILGGLGIGALGIGAAATGMFGEDAQNSVTDGLFDLGQATGMIPQVDPKDLAILKEKDPLAAMGNKPIGTREEVATQLAKGKSQLESLRNLQMVPRHMWPRILQKYDSTMTPEQAQLAAQNAYNILKDYDNPDSGLRTSMQQGQDYADSTGISGWAKEKAIPWYNWATGKQGSDMNIAQKIVYQHMAIKAARCWAGYEPVPGKAPYSENSCRPKATKKKKKTVEKSAEQYSSQPFNPAIGYKHPNSNATPMQAYKHQMYRSGREMAAFKKNPNYRFSADYNTAMQHYGGLAPRPPVETVTPSTAQAPPATPAAPVKPTASPGQLARLKSPVKAPVTQ